MINVNDEILKKHALGIEAAMNYYVKNIPTGLSDEYYDSLEKSAALDGLSLRDYVCQFIQGRRSQNADYIGKVEKCQVLGNMVEAVKDFQKKHPEITYWEPKYDGSSLAAYYDIDSGKLLKVVTIGGSNLGGEGIDQTEKFGKFFPSLPGTGIYALQCECLIALEKGYGEKSRQKANGLINSSYVPLDKSEFAGQDYDRYLKMFWENFVGVKKEVESLLTLRCFRYYGTNQGDQRTVLNSLPKVYDGNGDLKFSGGWVLTAEEMGEAMNADIWTTPDGTFLVDGIVGYTQSGSCVKALKYKDAGRGESTEVLGIQWNDQGKKGKDSWSANAIINPVEVRGTIIRKPTVGSIKKMIDGGISKGAKVTVIMANSTIPQVSNVLSPGNLDFEWPTCGCGRQLGPQDIFGALLKCSNPWCTEREGRMRNYLKGCKTFEEIDFNKLLVIDRFKFGNIGDGVKKILLGGYDLDYFKNYLKGFMTTDNQKKNLDIVGGPAFKVLCEYVGRI